MTIILPRRTVITGIASLFVAPAIVRMSSLMPINPLLVPEIGDGVELTSMEHPGWPRYYGLRGREIVELPSLEAWAATAFSGLRVGFTNIETGVEVSTVFLGRDHNINRNFDKSADQRPVLFETMVFGGERDEECRRYCTYDEAERGHAEMVAELRRRQWTVIEVKS